MLCCEWVCKLLIAKAALFYNGHPPQTAEWAEVLTGAEPLYQTLSTVTQLKDSLGKAMKREQQPARLHQNTKLSPQSLKQERPAWMSLWCATTHHRDTPNKTIITPSHTYTVPDWSALQTRTVFSEIFFFNCCFFFFPPEKKKAKNFLLASQVLVSCFRAASSIAIQTLSPALPQTPGLQLFGTVSTARDTLLSTLYFIPPCQRRRISPALITSEMVQQFYVNSLRALF